MAKPVKKKKAKKAKKAKPRKRKKKDGLCQHCEERPQADPFIYTEERVGGKVSIRFICFECSILLALESVE